MQQEVGYVLILAPNKLIVNNWVNEARNRFKWFTVYPVYRGDVCMKFSLCFLHNYATFFLAHCGVYLHTKTVQGG